MSLFKHSHQATAGSSLPFAESILNSLHEGIIMTDKTGTIEFINNAAAVMTESGGAKNAVGLDYALVIRIESKEGREFSEAENPLIRAMKTNQPLESFQAILVAAQSDSRTPVAITVIPASGGLQSSIITLRDITKELEEEGEQAEFISTASHEMRTPVATIDGYLSLALNPQTATIDERARGYLAAAQAASSHLGRLFQNLLDVTKLDDGKIKLHLEPVEMVGLIKNITNDYVDRAKEQKIAFSFGSNESSGFGHNRRMEQVVYAFVDVSFIREILDNLIENALKYTPEGGSIYVNVRGDGDKVLINVTDTGIGISSEDLTHIFQKFYRVDNSDTRTIGGNGLGLYLVKQRSEAMGGRVWAESAFGQGSTFYVSLPRLTSDEYEKRMIMVRNLEAQKQLEESQSAATQSPAPQPLSPQTPQSQTAVQQPPALQTPQSKIAVQQSPTLQTPQSQTATQQPLAPQPTTPIASRIPVIPESPPSSFAQKPTQITNNDNNINLNGETK